MTDPLPHLPYEDDERLADWVDGRMSVRDRERFEAELRVNPQLRQAAETYRRGVEAVRQVLRAPGPGVDVADAVLARIGAPAAAGPRPLRLFPLAASLLVAAAVVMVVVVLQGLEPATRRDDFAAAPVATGDKNLPAVLRTARDAADAEAGRALGPLAAGTEEVAGELKEQRGEGEPSLEARIEALRRFGEWQLGADFAGAADGGREPRELARPGAAAAQRLEDDAQRGRDGRQDESGSLGAAEFLRDDAARRNRLELQPSLPLLTLVPAAPALPPAPEGTRRRGAGDTLAERKDMPPPPAGSAEGSGAQKEKAVEKPGAQAAEQAAKAAPGEARRSAAPPPSGSQRERSVATLLALRDAVEPGRAGVAMDEEQVADRTQPAPPRLRQRPLPVDPAAVEALGFQEAPQLQGKVWLIEGEATAVRQWLGEISAAARREGYTLVHGEVPVALIEALVPALPASSATAVPAEPRPTGSMRLVIVVREAEATPPPDAQKR